MESKGNFGARKYLGYVAVGVIGLILGHSGNRGLEKRVGNFGTEMDLLDGRSNYSVREDTNAVKTNSEKMSREERKEYLKSKIGFKFEIENLEKEVVNPKYPMFTADTGQRYCFSISESIRGISSRLNILNYNYSIFFSDSSVWIWDDNYDNRPDSISLNDRKNNTELEIVRESSGKLRFDESKIDADSAKKFFEKYCKKWDDFRGSVEIEKRIEKYHWKLNINEILFGPGVPVEVNELGPNEIDLDAVLR